MVDELGEQAGGDASSLEAAMQALRRRGHQLEHSPARGVRLVRPTVLDAHLIERDLPVERIGRHVICFGEVDSTNDVAFGSAEQAGGESLVVTAEFQRAGRGRLGRQWTCPAGGGILTSVLLGGDTCELPQGLPVASIVEPLTIAAGLAVAEGVEQATGVSTQLEWPNDVAVGGAKAAGVLVETRTVGTDRPERSPGEGRRVVVGFGINVTAAPDPQAVERPATCLAAEGASTLERIEILRSVLVRADHWVAEIRTGNFDRLHDRWVERCGMINHRLTVRLGDELFTGRVLDVSPLGGLVLITDVGEQLRLPAAASSVEPWR